MLERNNFFEVPVFSSVYSKAEILKKDAVKYMLDSERKHKMGTPYSLNGYTSYCNGEPSILDVEIFSDLKEYILQCVNEVFKECEMYGTPFFTGSWFNINRKFSFHETHNHLPDIWSGIYYVDADQNDAPITFFDENKLTSWPWHAGGNLASSIRIPPYTGLLHIFPSFLLHSVSQQKQESERFSISFNINIEEAK